MTKINKEKQIIYVPVKVENEISKVAILHKERGFDFAYYMHNWKSFDHFKQGLSYKQNDITHWLKPQEGYFFTSEELNQLISSVVETTLKTASVNADTYIKSSTLVVDEESITNQFEEIYQQLKINE